MKKHHEENHIASAVIWSREQKLMARLDNLEGCEDNLVYASEVRKIRKELAAIRQFQEGSYNDPEAQSVDGAVEVREDDQGVTRSLNE